MISQQWVLCPVCGNKTRTKIRKDTKLINVPLYCPKCRKESLINVKNQIVTIVKEPDAKTEPIIPRMNEISWIIGLFYLKAKKWRITRPPLP